MRSQRISHVLPPASSGLCTCPPGSRWCPACAWVGSCLATNQPASLPSCWLSLEGGLLYAFVGPAAAVVLVRTPAPLARTEPLASPRPGLQLGLLPHQGHPGQQGPVGPSAQPGSFPWTQLAWWLCSGPVPIRRPVRV